MLKLQTKDEIWQGDNSQQTFAKNGFCDMAESSTLFVPENQKYFISLLLHGRSRWQQLVSYKCKLKYSHKIRQKFLKDIYRKVHF